MLGELFKLFGTIGLDTSEAEKGLDNITNKLDKKAKNFQNAGSKLTKGLTLPIVGLGTMAVMAGANFEQSMSKVEAISGATGKDLEDLTKKAQEMGKTTKFSASESADALTYMAMAGWEPVDMLDGLNGVMMLAASSGEDLATVSDIVTDAMTAFGMGANESSIFADLLAKTSSSANTNVGMLGESFKYVAPLFGSIGYSAEDAALALGLMANAGIKGAQAGTTLRAATSRLVNPVGEAGSLIEDMGLNITDAGGEMLPFRDVMGELRTKFKDLTPEQQAQSAATLFGQEAMSGMLSIINATDEDFAKLSEATTDYTGTAQEMADVMQDNAMGSIDKLKSAMEGMFIALSEDIVPIFTDVVDKITEWVSWFGNLDKKTQGNIVKFLAFAAALGPVLFIIGKLIAVGTTLTGIFIGVSAAIGGTTLAAGASTASLIAYNVAKAAGAVVSGVFTAATWLANAAVTAFGAVMAFITSPIGLAIAAIAAIIAIVYLLIKNWEKVKEVTEKVWNKIKDAIMGPVQAAVDFVKKMIDKIKGFFDFKWSLPKLKMPSVEIKGKFSLLPPKVPKFNLKWNADGFLMDRPNIFGQVGNTLLGGGEAGPEALLPLNRDVFGSIGEGIAKSSNFENPGLIDRLDAIIDLIIELIGVNPEFQVVLDSGVLAGELTPLINKRLGREADRKARGG